jgi:SAM-dependent methyltransferase
MPTRFPPLPPGATVSENSIGIDGIDFAINYSADSHHQESTPSCFVLPKTPEMVSAYYQLGQKTRIQNIVDLGIFKGGSAALFHRLFNPRRLLALDIREDRVAALDAYIQAQSAAAALRPFYGYDQADGPRLQRLIADQFEGTPLDLVVDDASHSYAPTRVSFNALFPSLRAGGYYVIEDWGWAHWDGWPHLPADYQKSGALFPDQPALTNLIFELVMAAATSPDLISTVTLTFNMAIVEKGPAVVDSETFDLGRHHISRGRRWQPIL